MYYSSWRKRFMYTGIFCIVAGIIIGVFASFSGTVDISQLINFFLWNPILVFGYITLSIGLILQFDKIKRGKQVQKLKSQTQQYSSLKEFVEDKVNQED